MSLIFRRSNASITDIVVVVTNFWGLLHKIKKKCSKKTKENKSVRKGHQGVQKMIKDWLKRFKSTKIEI
jgi:molecular chaperone GrpE (heat shock protein)